MVSDRKQHWDRIYAGRREDEVSWYQEHPERSVEVIRALTRDTAAPLIDVGGGSSRLVDHLVAAGYTDVTVLDVAEQSLDHARRRLDHATQHVTWIVADVLTFAPPRRYALWHDRAVFHFLSDAEERSAYIDTLAAAVAPGGYVAIATFAADGPQQCSGLPVQRYSSTLLTEALASVCSPLGFEHELHRTPAGAEQHFLYGHFRRIPNT